MIKYKVKTKDQKEKDYDVIEKSGITHTFTIQEVKDEEARFEKMVKEIEANIEVKNAIVANVVNNNEWIKEMPKEKIHACHMYWEAHAYVQGGLAKIKEIKDAIKESKAERKEIEKQAYGK